MSLSAHVVTSRDDNRSQKAREVQASARRVKACKCGLIIALTIRSQYMWECRPEGKTSVFVPRVADKYWCSLVLRFGIP